LHWCRGVARVRGVQVDVGCREPRPRSQQLGSLRPRALRVVVLEVGTGGGRPLLLRASGMSPPEFFLRFLMPNPAFVGNLGQKIN